MDNPLRRAIVSPMTQDWDVVIAGGGLVGTSQALAFAQGGLRVALVDRLTSETRAAPTFDGRSYAISRGSQRILDGIGLWRTLGAPQPILEVKVTDGHAADRVSPFSLHFDHAEIEEGPMGFMVEDRHLRPALLEAVAAQPMITHLAGQEITGHDAGRITLASGQTLTASLLVGADGVRGQTGPRAGIQHMTWGYGQTALVAALEIERPHDGVARQIFLPPGPLAILPLAKNRVSIVWSEAEATARAFLALDDEAFLEMLRPRFGDALGKIKLAGARYSYPLGLSVAERFVAQRLALVGDAAHKVHPIAGQGLNAGLRDIATLAEVVVDARRRGEDMGSDLVLERYESWRRFDTTSLAAATDGFNRLFSNDNPLLRLGRDLGMGVVNAIPGLRRALIREAAGLSGDLPRLARGLPL